MATTWFRQETQQVWAMQKMKVIKHRGGMTFLFVTTLQCGFCKDILPCMLHENFGYSSIVFLDTIQQIVEHMI